MKTRFKIQQWLQGEDIPRQDEFSQINSFCKDYANEGDEFLDDAIRTFDQDFEQIDGTYEAWKMRSARTLNK